MIQLPNNIAEAESSHKAFKINKSGSMLLYDADKLSDNSLESRICLKVKTYEQIVLWLGHCSSGSHPIESPDSDKTWT